MNVDGAESLQRILDCLERIKETIPRAYFGMPDDIMSDIERRLAGVAEDLDFVAMPSMQAFLKTITVDKHSGQSIPEGRTTLYDLD